MTTRLTADIVADLRGWTLKRATDDEAADRLTEEDRKRRFFETCNQIAQDKLAAIDALRPPCPTCGGLRIIDKWNLNDETNERQPCPDCTNGKMPYERAWQIVAAVFTDPMGLKPEGHPTCEDCALCLLEYLRGIR